MSSQSVRPHVAYRFMPQRVRPFHSAQNDGRESFYQILHRLLGPRKPRGYHTFTIKHPSDNRRGISKYVAPRSRYASRNINCCDHLTW